MKNHLLTVGLSVAALTAAQAQFQGPSSSRTSYIEPTAPGWNSTALLSVGDSVGGYSMVGIPDGLGAYDNENGTITLLMNHELGATQGVARAHGSAGAFVSKWIIDKNTLQVTSGMDMVQSSSDVFTWNGSSFTAGTTAFGRLCSADLPALSAFYDGVNGYNGRIYMNGEETGNEGRAWAFVATGTSAGRAYELPKLGKFSWENSVARPTSGTQTVVAGLDDSSPGQVYFYVGNKTASGNAVERAGLHNGNLYGLKVTGVPDELTASHNTSGVSGNFTLELINTSANGTLQQSESETLGVTEFARPEDGQWLDDDTFLFVTTGNTIGGSAKLYRADFANPMDLTAGGTVSMVLNSSSLLGTDAANARSFDNMTVGEDGLIYIQEDPGGSDYIAKVWQVNLSSPTAAVQLFESDRDRFAPPLMSPYNNDEEHSGIIDVTSLFSDASWFQAGQKVFLGDTQAHYSLPGELVQGGQLQIMSNMAIPEPSTYALLLMGAVGGFFAFRSRRA